MTSWKTVSLCALDNNNYCDVPEGENAQRVALLREYRSQGAMEAFLCSAEELEDMADDDATEAGPSVAEIDWTGFPVERPVTLVVHDEDGAVAEGWRHLGYADSEQAAYDLAANRGLLFDRVELGADPSRTTPSGDVPTSWMVYSV